MANLTTVVAMIPLALGLGMGGGFQAPMAIVSIGGMIGGGFLARLSQLAAKNEKIEIIFNISY